jgi:hypothetical protein
MAEHHWNIWFSQGVSPIGSPVCFVASNTQTSSNCVCVLRVSAEFYFLVYTTFMILHVASFWLLHILNRELSYIVYPMWSSPYRSSRRRMVYVSLFALRYLALFGWSDRRIYRISERGAFYLLLSRKKTNQGSWFSYCSPLSLVGLVGGQVVSLADVTPVDINLKFVKDLDQLSHKVSD